MKYGNDKDAQRYYGYTSNNDGMQMYNNLENVIATLAIRRIVCSCIQLNSCLPIIMSDGCKYLLLAEIATGNSLHNSKWNVRWELRNILDSFYSIFCDPY